MSSPWRRAAISRASALGYPNARVVGLIIVGTACAWMFWRMRKATSLACAAAWAGWSAYAYALCAAQVHENHLFAVVPLLVLAGAGRPRFRPVLWTVSVIFALNLNAFYGVSEYIDGWAVPRAATIVDLTVLLAIANCAALAWHARVLEAECAGLRADGQRLK